MSIAVKSGVALIPQLDLSGTQMKTTYKNEVLSGGKL
jgi:hypothetical protein